MVHLFNDSINISFVSKHYNGTTRNSSLSSDTSMVETLLFALFYAVITIVATLGNLLVIVAISFNHNLQTTSNYLLANLALTDFLQGLISVPLRLAETVIINKDIRVLCQVSIPTSVFFGSTSNLSIMFISIERFIAIFVPYFYYSVVSLKAILVVITTGWIFMLIFTLLPSVGIGGLTPLEPVLFCRFPSFLSSSYITTLYIIVHFIPITTVSLIYGFILRASMNHARRIHVQQTAGRHNRTGEEDTPANSTAPSCTDTTAQAVMHSTKQRKAARIVSYVLGFFIILVSPIIIVDLIEMLGGPRAPDVFVKVAVCMIYTNHCVNVFVYAGCNREYRKAFVKTFSSIKNYICEK